MLSSSSILRHFLLNAVLALFVQRMTQHKLIGKYRHLQINLGTI